MEKENLSPQESLALIQDMIEKARHNMCNNSIYFLLWGWVTFVGFIGQFVLKVILKYPNHSLAWLLVIPAVIATMYLGAKQHKQRKATAYIDDAMGYLWTGMGISFFVLSMILSKIGWGTPIFPFFIMLYGLGTFVSGRLLQFSPLVVGGVVAWALAIVAVYVPYDYQMLCGAAAVVVSYIIPAYLLRKQELVTKY